MYSPGRFLGVLLLCSLWGVAVAAPPAVHEYRLENGLQVLVREDHRAPVVVSQVWYKVGSSYEDGGTTGISHVLEHMMFKGTPQYPDGTFSRRIAEQGGEENAFTSRDYTAYFQTLERSHLETSFRLEADRMQHLVLSDEAFARELRVVQEERRLRTVDQPQALLSEHFHAVAFLHNPYRFPVIGWMSDLEALTIDRVRAWYQRWYAPNNAIVVVVGDVEPDEVRVLAEKHFGAVPKRSIIPPPERSEPPQYGARRVTVQVPAKVPAILLGYQVPVLKTATDASEAYALEVLAGLLAGGDSARLVRELIRGSQVAAAVDASYDLYARLPSHFLLDGIPAQGTPLAALEDALHEQIARLQEAPVASSELERVKARVVAENIYKKDSMFTQAMELGILQSVGLGWQHAEVYVERVRAVTAEQVQQVARKYLIEESLTTAILEPLPVQDAQQQAPETVPARIHHRTP